MLSEKQIKLINSLHHKKFRKEHGLFIAEGVKTVNELLRSSCKIHSILGIRDWGLGMSDEKRYNSLIPNPQSPIPIIEITEKELKKISNLETPNQVLAIAEIPKPEFKIEALHNELTLALDDIKDPGNFGTILRIAEWFGIKNVLCSKECVDAYNPKCVQASMGSIFRVNVHELNLEEVFAEICNQSPIPNPQSLIPIYAAMLKGENVYEKPLSRNGILLIGSESHGVSAGLLEYVSTRLFIPSYNKGAESLNAAFAAAILCAEFRRREGV